MKEWMREKKEMKEVYKQRKNERRVDKQTHGEIYRQTERETHTNKHTHNTQTQT